jgi:large subunit ribosomal protein L25
MAEITLQAESGRTTGTRASGRLRHEGRIPAVIYGHGISPIPVSVDGRELRAALSTDAGLNALLSLNVGGTAHLTMARELQRHPVRGTVTHVDFQIVRRDEVVSADVPVHLVGEALQVTRNDGVVSQELHTITVNATPDKLPHAIEIDINELVVGDTIRVGDLKLPAGVSSDLDAVEPVVVAAASTLAAEAVAEAAEGEAGAEAAEGGAAEGEGEAAAAESAGEAEG